MNVKAMPEQSQQHQHFDILVIGGGINGAGIARDAVGRGYSVCLCEAGDFAGGTSSASTKLIHGGLRYLEYYEFRLVREALRERELLWSLAPHIIWPLRFVLPHNKGMRPAWLLRLGLFLYDHLGGRKRLPPTKGVALAEGPLGEPLKPGFSKGWEYSDCWVDDARLVVLNLRDARARGADIRARTRVTRARRDGAGWAVKLEHDGAVQTVTAGLIVNAAGPWVDDVLRNVFDERTAQNVRLVRGSHIVVPRKTCHDRAYILQQGDGRIIFAIPYEQDFTLIGTTDVDQGADLSPPRISDDERDYLCDMASTYFREPVTPEDVVWTYSGVRPLYDDGASAAQEATRDYVIRDDGAADQAALLNIFGGKITTYRRLAESVLDKIEHRLGAKGARWTSHGTLPGGDFPVEGVDTLIAHMQARFPFVPAPFIPRMVRTHGTDLPAVLGQAETPEALGQYFGAGLYQAEVDYFVREEWAKTADDILYRRTKLGLHMSKEERAALAAHLDA
ncbi:MAG: glycerol-3-phosphate dehydrogenase [Brevirhabdus sp.]